MLFMITMTHDYSTCQTYDPERGPLWKNTLASLPDHGLKIHANYVNRLEHKGYMVVEADSFEQIDAAFDPGNNNSYPADNEFTEYYNYPNAKPCYW